MRFYPLLGLSLLLHLLTLSRPNMHEADGCYTSSAIESEAHMTLKSFALDLALLSC